VPSSGPGGTFAGSVTVPTDTSGLATAGALTANTVAGSYAVTASVVGAGSASFSLTNTAGTPASITAIGGTPQSANVGTNYVASLQVRVTDAFGNPVGGAAVTFAAPGSGPGGTFAGSTTVLTDATGLATAPTLTANGNPGSFVVTATVPGAATAAAFQLTNVRSELLQTTTGLTVTLLLAPARGILLTAAVSAASGTPTGSVAFLDVFRRKPRVLGTVPLTDGVVTLPVLLPVGWHRLRALYSADSTYAGSSSALVPFKVRRGPRRGILRSPALLVRLRRVVGG
jgi:hypothetical protein